MAEISFHIERMTCGGCVSRVERALRSVENVEDATANFADKSATVRTGSAPSASMRDRLVEALTKAGYPPRLVHADLQIPGLNCGACVARVETALADHPDLISASANLADRSVHIVATSDAGLDTARHALTDAGYPPAAPAAEETPQAPAIDEMAELRSATLLAAVLTVPLFILEMGGHIYPPFHMWLHHLIGQQALWLVQMILATIVVLGPGLRFHKQGWPSLLRGAPDMNALVAIGTSAAMVYSSIATLLPDLLPDTARAVYFEAAALIVALILAGRWMEARARGQTGEAIRKLAGLQPRMARRVTDAGVEEVPLAAILPGDLLEIRAGAAIPVDGRVVEGRSHVDESMFTGEPLPVPKEVEDALRAGTVNGPAVMTMRATHVGQETALARIIDMVRRAQATRLPVQDLVNRIAGWFVPAVLVIATLTALTWLLLTGEPSRALIAAVSVLIVACPCAMGLAVPVSIMVGTGRAADLGILYRNGSALQQLADIRAIAFDKTGTLTEGKPRVTQVLAQPGSNHTELLQLAAAVERQSDHPLAGAILDAAAELAPLTASDLHEQPGQGLTANVEGMPVSVGNAGLMEALGIAIPSEPAAHATVVYVARAEALLGELHIEDTLRPDAAQTLTTLRADGLETAVVSGDRAEVARHIAGQLAIDHVFGDAQPDAKVRALNSLPSPTAFVGDGINDAPVLATAEVGIALGTGTDIAMEAGDVVLMRPALSGVTDAIRLSRATLRNIRQNLFWAFGYNVALIPVAAGVLVPLGGPMLSPALAAGAMALSSVFVLTNALRLRHA